MLTQADLESTLHAAEYVNRFRSLCRLGVTSPIATYVLMERYAHINGFAGSAVALLAGNIGYRRELFLDPVGGSNPDRGMKIAAKVFMATIDEHGGRRGAGPHRSMAQACLDKVAEYAELDEAARLPLDLKSPAFLGIVEQFKASYAAAGRETPSLMHAIGYHVASEYFADLEYQILDEELWHKSPRKSFQDIVRRTRTDSGWGGPWAWITVHGHYGAAENDDGHGVEEEHFQGALDALRFLEKYQPAELPSSEIKRLVVDGTLAFRGDFLTVFDLIAAEIEAIANNKSASLCSNGACVSDACCPQEAASARAEEAEASAVA